tara:strand:- start:3205 stop:3579 length:375 start_codon:yes stop_codon:yes gene_type:complete
MSRKRKAVSCLLVEENNETGYHKYILDIQEDDGSIKTSIPAYGEDMSDAIKRLVKKENKEKLNKIYVNKVEPTVMISVVLVWLIMIGLSMFIPDRPEYALYGTIGLMSIVMIIAVQNFIKNFNK